MWVLKHWPAISFFLRDEANVRATEDWKRAKWFWRRNLFARFRFRGLSVGEVTEILLSFFFPPFFSRCFILTLLTGARSRVPVRNRHLFSISSRLQLLIVFYYYSIDQSSNIQNTLILQLRVWISFVIMQEITFVSLKVQKKERFILAIFGYK